MKKNEVDEFEKIVAQVHGLYEELSILSKKSPNDAVNKFKLGFVNSLLDASNTFLGVRYVPFPDFSRFDVDVVPQNSDVVFILSQYLGCFEKFRSDNVVRRGGGMWYWKVKPEKGDVPSDDGWVYVSTVKPKGLRD